LLPGGCRTRFLTVIVTHGPVPFMEKFRIVTERALWTSGKVQNFRGKTNGIILPLRRI